jgi:hypothetical protein
MRTSLITFCAVCVTVTAPIQTRALETDTFSLKQSGNSHTAPVSFSVSYPKGWRHLQGFGSQAKLSDFTIVDGDSICMFWPTNTSSTSFAIWRASGATAEAAAGEFSASLRHRGITNQNLTSVKTAGGEIGCLVESESTIEVGYGVGPTGKNGAKRGQIPAAILSQSQGAPLDQQRVITHNYFFHSGAKGSVRITIETPVTDAAQLAELDQLVLKTLQFDSAPKPPADASQPVATE